MTIIDTHDDHSITFWDQPIPLSYGQSRLWFLDKLIELPIYNIPTFLKLKGVIDIELLIKAFKRIISRHDILRTVFKSSDGIVEQLILAELSDEVIKVLDISLMEDEIKQQEADKYIKAAVGKKFDLSIGPLINIQILKTHQEECILLITMHHIISDGWSMSIFFKELSNLYNSFVQGKEGQLEDLEIQYSDYSIWQRQWLQGEILDKQLFYWKNQLNGIQDTIELPKDKLRPKELTYQGGSYYCSISKKTKDKLKGLSQQYQVSLFMVLLSVFKILLNKYSGQEDIVVGTPIANRNHKEIEGLIGLFVNTIAIRTIFQKGQTFAQVLNAIRETTLSAYDHQDVPFEQLVDHLNVLRALNRNPVFQVMFSLQNINRDDISLDGLEIEYIESEYNISKFDLTLSAAESDSGIELRFEYSTDLFEDDTIKRMAGHYCRIVEEVRR